MHKYLLSTFSDKIPMTFSEYGMGGVISTQGDVYSYGILLLEMLTRKRPTDDAFIGELDLHNYVKMNFASEGQVLRIIDPLLLSLKMEENREIESNKSEGHCNLSTIQKGIVPMFEIALKCSARSPNDRIDMNEVLRQLQFIRDHFISAQIN